MRPFNAEYIFIALKQLLPFTGRTLLVTVIAIVFGTILGAVLAWGKLSSNKTARFLSSFYVHIIRCTPSIVLLFLVYYGIPKLIELFTGKYSGYSGKMWYVAITLSLLFAASMCELFRSAYSAVDSGQKEAAFCCGMTKFQTAWIIIIPQALTAAIPVFCTAVVGLLKQGALAFTIGFIDLAGQADVIVARAYGAHGLETYIALAAIYWLITIVIEQCLKYAERLASRGKTIPGQGDSSWT